MISVFGARGFVGSHFLKQFPEETVAVPRDERNPPTDEILYLISTTHNYHVFDDLKKDVETNLSVLMEVLEAVRERDVVINFVSSWFVYGPTPLPARESSPCDPRGFYSITKRCAEQLLESFCRTFDKRYRILRLSNIYGRGDQGASARKNALQFLIERLRRHEPIELYHGGEFQRDYLWVEDACRALRLVLREGPLNEVTNVGSGIGYRFRDLIDRVVEFTESRSEIRAVPPPPFHQAVQVKDMVLDVSKLRGLGFSPEVTIEEGLRRLCQT